MEKLRDNRDKHDSHLREEIFKLLPRGICCTTTEDKCSPALCPFVRKTMELISWAGYKSPEEIKQGAEQAYRLMKYDVGERSEEDFVRLVMMKMEAKNDIKKESASTL